MSSSQEHEHPARRLQSRIDQCQHNSTADLIKQELTDTDMDIIVKQLIIKKQCKKLLLSENQITSIGSSIIAMALKNNTTLKFLSLSYNPLSDEGVQSLAKILALNNSKLETLSLHKTAITDKSAQYLSDMLKTNTSLIWLHIGKNEISDQGISLLVDALTHYNNTLKVLALSENKSITDLSIDPLVEMLEYNTSLETLWINKCNLSIQGKKKLQQAVTSIRRFFFLYI